MDRRSSTRGALTAPSTAPAQRTPDGPPDRPLDGPAHLPADLPLDAPPEVPDDAPLGERPDHPTGAADELAAFGAFGPASVAWRLDREAYLLLGAGPRALLLQLAHPLVAEGVAQHSGFRADPWGRLAATLTSYLGIVYGPRPRAEAEIERLARLHRRVSGPVEDPEARRVTGATVYSALDPSLSLWVHATLVDSTLVAFEAWREPLAEVDRARFYAETLPLGRAFGIPAELLPADLVAFETYLARMMGPDGPVHVTPTARDLAGAILHPPLPPELERVGRLGRAASHVPPALYDWTLWPALELLPASVRAEYGIPASALRSAVSTWLVAAWRRSPAIMPSALRWMPQARRADERTRRHTGLAGRGIGGHGRPDAADGQGVDGRGVDGDPAGHRGSGRA